ncbi:L-histidine N(alpha)-methyltransferase [Mesorhizobium sp. BAC0120]|uniref:L-histidine N(alpha)-methyltransferase n=1 Tax=Mesorhizobium sp. BAC0120 TaxID=3090670 RepID=UPI00298D44FE|nr:L-histidine N(alpha)-methyltransferase [Mesorhizobium sp. BAC0120]MDW6026066.1 L-histidine N(alpha)-methyltransferase [Mesorhizobium sp. BAC0120]
MATSSAARQMPHDEARCEFARQILAGLTASPKHIAPKYFYDSTGSELFERITEQPEYYPTRIEIALLRQNARKIVGLFPPGGALVEFGMGSTTKARILLQAATSLSAYVPVDISADHLRDEAKPLALDFPHLEILPVAADFTQPFELPPSIRSQPRVGFFPGSTIGNFEPEEAILLLQRFAKVLGEGALLIVGVDLVKDPEVLDAAYNDARGVTAAFNLNLLTRINHELGGNFDLRSFEHRAFYNRSRNRVEMHLVSLKPQRVRVNGKVIDFQAGETIHTENSYKYSIESFHALARSAGSKPVAVWVDTQKYFSIHMLAFEGEVR